MGFESIGQHSKLIKELEGQPLRVPQTILSLTEFDVSVFNDNWKELKEGILKESSEKGAKLSNTKKRDARLKLREWYISKINETAPPTGPPPPLTLTNRFFFLLSVLHCERVPLHIPLRWFATHPTHSTLHGELKKLFFSRLVEGISPWVNGPNLSKKKNFLALRAAMRESPSPHPAQVVRDAPNAQHSPWRAKKTFFSRLVEGISPWVNGPNQSKKTIFLALRAAMRESPSPHPAQVVRDAPNAQHSPWRAKIKK